MQLSSDSKLIWERIRDFAMDDPLANVKYSDKLAHHNGWSKEYASKVIEEYKKFIFLCYILPQGAAPSKPIDEAWHLHLTYTHSYWKQLCKDILGKEIHHFPSKGGPEERDKYVQWYIDTLNAYKEIFKEEAPTDIWIEEFQTPVQAGLKDKIVTDYFAWYRKYLYILFFPFIIIAILYGKIIPYQLAGPQFLVFFSCLIVAGIIYLWLIRSKKKMEVEELIAELYPGDADIYQLARFLYGRERSLRAAIVDLAERKILEPKRKGLFAFTVSNYKYLITEKNPLLIYLLRNVRDGETIHYTSLSNYYDDASTYHAGLADLYKSISVKDRWPIVITSSVLIIGVARMFQGFYNDKPVSYLFALCFVYLFISLIAVSVSSGKSIVQQVFQDSYKKGGVAEYQSASTVSSFVFMGLAYIPAIAGYSQLNNTFNRYGANANSGSSGGCGSSGCGSDGGGGCGSGCGGCGGGD
ncbi:MAG: hypothetical protein ABI675_20435 [Chitinophagaceae bacterium]